MTAPIYFNVPAAREFFLKNGYVYTIRHERATGNTTARYGGFFRFILLGNVRIIKTLSLDRAAEAKQLHNFVPYSGFETVWDWLRVVKKWEIPMALYLVEALK